MNKKLIAGTGVSTAMRSIVVKDIYLSLGLATTTAARPSDR